jgi:diamine N-acetyltransferase
LTFRAAYEAELAGPALDRYIADHYSPAKQAAELADERLTYLIVELAGAMIGFALLRTDEHHPAISGERPVMLSQIYLDPTHTGGGIGSTLMRRCLAEASAAGHDTMWLGVWERNARAIAFYERWGFARGGGDGVRLRRARPARPGHAARGGRPRRLEDGADAGGEQPDDEDDADDDAEEDAAHGAPFVLISPDQ